MDKTNPEHGGQHDRSSLAPVEPSTIDRGVSVPTAPAPAASVRLPPAVSREVVLAMTTMLCEGRSIREVESALLAVPGLRPHAEAVVVLCRCIEHGHPAPESLPGMARSLVDICRRAPDAASRDRGLRCLWRYALVCRSLAAPVSIPRAFPYFGGALLSWGTSHSLLSGYRHGYGEGVVSTLLRPIADLLFRNTGTVFMSSLVGCVVIYLFSDRRWIQLLREMLAWILGMHVRSHVSQLEARAVAQAGWSAGVGTVDPVGCTDSGLTSELLLLSALSRSGHQDAAVILEAEAFRAVARAEQARGHLGLVLDFVQGALTMILIAIFTVLYM
ncbi:MAG: hypothetical protein HY815_06880 [Candidatus Riflebacteria bacterium]|nr:hypothetical protein [Candidatus Riflebacteria bacterium]